MAYVGGLHIFKECREQSYTMQFSDNLPVEVNIDVYALYSLPTSSTTLEGLNLYM